MKTNLKRLFALLMALSLLFALCATAVFADEDDDPDEHATGLLTPDVFVIFTMYEVQLDVGESTSVTASVEGADPGARYEWSCDDPSVAAIRGSGDTVSVTGKGAGTAQVSLTVTRSDGLSSDYDSFYVNVGGSEPVLVSGGGEVETEEGETVSLRASVSGGSGSYNYEWDAFGEAALSITDRERANAMVYAGRSGTGRVVLTVYDAEDRGNYDLVTWDFTVTGSQASTPPEIELNRGTVDLGVGGTGSLSVLATGGSGDYEYIWYSDNSGVVSVRGSGANVEIQATDTLLPGSNQAEISVYVRDRKTGLSSNTESCVVNVTGGETTYNAYDIAEVGIAMPLNAVAGEIAAAYQTAFGAQLSYSASVKFESTGSAVGSIRLQDDSTARAGTSYSFAVFQDMFFKAAASGTFNTYYMIVDGGNTIYGTLSVEASGGIGVKSATLSSSSLSMTTNSSQYLTLTVLPSNATYTVNWQSSDTRVVSVSGSGNQVVLRTGNASGSASVVATVTDASGFTTRCTCQVTVSAPAPINPDVYYDLTLSVTLGSDYTGTKLSDAMIAKFRSAFGYYPKDSDTVAFPSLGDSRYGTIYTRNGAPVTAGRAYNLRDWTDMYFVPAAAGTYTMSYQLYHGSSIMRGEIKISIDAASLNVSMNPTALQMAPYSSQYITLSISPASAYYRVSWISSNNSVCTVAGSNTTATVASSGVGSATITAVVTDSRGVEIRKSCTVLVSTAGSTFNPTVATTLGIPYIGTGVSSAMRSQFASVYGITLADNATIRFSTVGNTDVGVLRLADGSMIQANRDYTLAQFVAMYTQPVSAGTYSVPYVLTYAGKTLSGTVNVTVSSAAVSTNITLPANAPYWFSEAAGGSTGSAILADSIRNSVGSGWSYLRFSAVASDAGTLYLDRNFNSISAATNITPAALAQLYFVPGTLNGTFSAPYTIYAGNGAVLGTGTLNIARPGVQFTDVPANAYYAPAVNWAVSRGITSGTGGTNFSPDMTVTRGQAVTFLWRAAGQPKPVTTTNPFWDVAAGTYYYDAVLWAVQQGITNGTGDNIFSPDAQLNRDMLLTFLCRANGGYAGGSDWSQLAVNWATNRGLLAGVPGTFVPNSACPRSDVVYYLWKNYNG